MMTGKLYFINTIGIIVVLYENNKIILTSNVENGFKTIDFKNAELLFSKMKKPNQEDLDFLIKIDSSMSTKEIDCCNKTKEETIISALNSLITNNKNFFIEIFKEEMKNISNVEDNLLFYANLSNGIYSKYIENSKNMIEEIKDGNWKGLVLLETLYSTNKIDYSIKIPEKNNKELYLHIREKVGDLKISHFIFRGTTNPIRYICAYIRLFCNKNYLKIDCDDEIILFSGHSYGAKLAYEHYKFFKKKNKNVYAYLYALPTFLLNHTYEDSGNNYIKVIKTLKSKESEREVEAAGVDIESAVVADVGFDGFSNLFLSVTIIFALIFSSIFYLLLGILGVSIVVLMVIVVLGSLYLNSKKNHAIKEFSSKNLSGLNYQQIDKNYIYFNKYNPNLYFLASMQKKINDGIKICVTENYYCKEKIIKNKDTCLDKWLSETINKESVEEVVESFIKNKELLVDMKEQIIKEKQESLIKFLNFVKQELVEKRNK